MTWRPRRVQSRGTEVHKKTPAWATLRSMAHMSHFFQHCWAFIVKDFTVMCQFCQQCGGNRGYWPFCAFWRWEDPPQKVHKYPKTEKKYFAANPSRGPKNTFARKIRSNGAWEGTFRWCIRVAVIAASPKKMCPQPCHSPSERNRSVAQRPHSPPRPCNTIRKAFTLPW